MYRGCQSLTVSFMSELEVTDFLSTQEGRTVTEKHTELHSWSALGLRNDFKMGKAVGEGDCSFDTLTQGINQLSIAGGLYDVTTLRQASSDYAKCNRDSIYNSQTSKMLWEGVQQRTAILTQILKAILCILDYQQKKELF